MKPLLCIRLVNMYFSMLIIIFHCWRPSVSSPPAMYTKLNHQYSKVFFPFFIFSSFFTLKRFRVELFKFETAITWVNTKFIYFVKLKKTWIWILNLPGHMWKQSWTNCDKNNIFGKRSSVWLLTPWTGYSQTLNRTCLTK